MAYHRASKKQLAYIASLADQTRTPLPWGWEGYSASKANKLIASLKRKVEPVGQPSEAEPRPQTSLF